MKNKQYTLPSFFLISSAVDGNENAIEKLLLFLKPTYQNAVYARFTMNTATYTLWLIWN